MIQQPNSPRRRTFLAAAATAGVALPLDGLDFVGQLPRVSASEARLPKGSVAFADDIEPLVRLLEETPRNQVIERFAAKIVAGTSYREVLTALLLAGVRNVQPRPSVGFKFHAVLVVNSAHIASLAAREEERWLPIFWALDYFKSSQASDRREGDWTMAAVDEARLPPSHKAREALREAMENWDVQAADVAVAALCRSASAAELFDLLAHHGCRDYRSIGHKAIYVSNSYRALNCIGWRHAEPVLRSLTYALLNHNGEPNPAEAELRPDSAWRRTQQELASARITVLGSGGAPDVGATLSLLDTLRSATPEEAVGEVASLLRSGIAVQSISDALFLSAGEMLGQQPGIVALHSATTTNAMQFAYRTAYDQRTRWELLLQNAAFIPYFRQSMRDRGDVGSERIEVKFEETELANPPELAEIFDAMSTDRRQAEQSALRFLRAGGRAEDVIATARRLVFSKGNDSHDYKFSSAVLEDYYAVSPRFRAAFLASAAHLLPGSHDRENGLAERVQAAMA